MKISDGESEVGLHRISAGLLRGVGVLLVVLGVIHLVATPHIPALLNGSPRTVYERAVGPTLLNHVLVGILLLPLGYTTWLAAGSSARGESWARRVLAMNAFVLLTLPVSIIVFMRQPEFYQSPLFVTGVALVAITSLLMVTATYLLTRNRSHLGR